MNADLMFTVVIIQLIQKEMITIEHFVDTPLNAGL